MHKSARGRPSLVSMGVKTSTKSNRSSEAVYSWMRRLVALTSVEELLSRAGHGLMAM